MYQIVTLKLLVANITHYVCENLKYTFSNAFVSFLLLSMNCFTKLVSNGYFETDCCITKTVIKVSVSIKTSS